MIKTDKKIVLVMGYPGAGKSTYTKKLIKESWFNLNRDIEGGTREEYNAKVEGLMKKGERRIVLDNTYPDVSSRSGPVALAKKYGYRIEAWVMQSTIQDAMFNAVRRQIERYGKILSVKELADTKDSNMFPVAVLYQYKKKFVKPTQEEGFDMVLDLPFKREYPSTHKTKALILDYDGTLRTCISGQNYPLTCKDISILPGRKEKIHEYIRKGYKIIGVSNQSGIGKGIIMDEQVRDMFTYTNKELGIDIPVYYCPHTVPPVTCFCRKPSPGMAADIIYKYELDPSQCIMVGDMASDKNFATYAGFQYVDQAKFFV